MAEWKKYRRKGLTVAREYVPGEDLTGISVADSDKARASLAGGLIARNQDNPADQWYINPEYVAANLELIE